MATTIFDDTTLCPATATALTYAVPGLSDAAVQAFRAYTAPLAAEATAVLAALDRHAISLREVAEL